MSADQWEKYVEPAAKAQEQFWAPLRGHTDYPDEIDFGLARAVLAVVGPLIAEDTRERVVAAAARAVERTCSSPHGNRGDGRGCEDDHCPRHGEPEEEAG